MVGLVMLLAVAVSVMVVLYLRRGMEVRLLRAELGKAKTEIRNLHQFVVMKNRRLVYWIKEAFHDPLTGAPNRRYVNRILHGWQYRQSIGRGLAIFLLDLDHFKPINDILGYEAGDEALESLVTLLEKHVKTRGGFFARLGGDEFLVLYSDVTKPQAGALGRSLSEAFAELLRIVSTHLMLLASIGGDWTGERNFDPRQMMSHADSALKKLAKSSPMKPGFAMWSPEIEVELQRRRNHNHQFWRMIQEKEYELAFMPIVELATGQITSAEVTVRSGNGEGDLSQLYGDDDEAAAHLQQLFRSVIDVAFPVLARVNEGRDRPIVLSVNIIPAQLLAAAITLRHLRRMATKHGVDLRWLAVELIEWQPVKDYGKAKEGVRRFQEEGVAVYIDDQRHDLPSLLKAQLGADAIKIDKFLIHLLGHSREAYRNALTQTYTALNEGQQVIAEGVETVEQLRQVRRMGCTHVQGYLVSRPLLAGAFEDLLRETSRLDLPA